MSAPETEPCPVSYRTNGWRKRAQTARSETELQVEEAFGREASGFSVSTSDGGSGYRLALHRHRCLVVVGTKTELTSDENKGRLKSE